MTAPIHVRTVRVEAAPVGEGELEVTGRLVDERPRGGPRWWGVEEETTIHDMSLTIRVRCPDLRITHVGGSMAARPYTLCTDALPPLQELVGLSVAQGFTRAVNERFGRQQGCAHLTALIHAMAPVVRQAAGAISHHQPMASGDGDLWFINTCQAWREDGPLAQRLKARDEEGLRALVARRRSG